MATSAPDYITFVRYLELLEEEDLPASFASHASRIIDAVLLIGTTIDILQQKRKGMSI